MTAAVAERLEGVDPGFVRSRRGVRAVCATVLAWATMVAVTAVFDVADPVRITLFAAGAAFEGALLAPDPQPRDRVRTLGWASVVAAVAVVVTVALTQTAVWVAAALLVLLMFSSYALGRRRSQSTPPVGRSRNDRNLQFLTIDHYQPGLRRLCLAFSVDDRTGYGPRPDDGT